MSETPVCVSYAPSSSASNVSAPSALLLACIAHIKISFDDVCDTSPRMWKRLNFIVGTKTATRLQGSRLSLASWRAKQMDGHAVPVRLSANERESLSRCAKQQFPS